MERKTQQLYPGRLSITCIDAKNIRGRANNSSENLAPYLLFRLRDGTERSSKSGNIIGHDIIFSNEVISFDIPIPDDVELVIELRDDASNESVGKATYSISDVLTSPGAQKAETLEIIKPGDSTTNSVVNLQFDFVQAKQGVIKLSLGVGSMQQIMGGSSKHMYAMISTPDGQSRKTLLADADNALGFWIDPSNWSGDFTVQLFKCNDCMGSGKLSLLGCLTGSEIKKSTSYVPIKTDDGQVVQASLITVKHCFLEAGFVHVHSIVASNLRDVSIGSTGLENPRIIVKSRGKTHSTMSMTKNAAVTNAESTAHNLWNDAICVPVVDEYTLTIECCEYDEVSGDKEPIGSADVSLLPLFKMGHLEVTLDLKLVTEVRMTRVACVVCEEFLQKR